MTIKEIIEKRRKEAIDFINAGNSVEYWEGKRDAYSDVLRGLKVIHCKKREKVVILEKFTGIPVLKEMPCERCEQKMEAKQIDGEWFYIHP